MRLTRLRALPQRFGPGSKRRGTRITFRLSAPARVVFVVRGPAPSCTIVRRFSVRGRPGINQIRLTARIGRRTLVPGTYALTARARGLTRPMQRVVIIVGTGPRTRFDCTAAREGFSFAAAFPFSAERVTTAAAAPPVGEESPERRGVLPAIAREIRELPRKVQIPPLPELPIPNDAADAPPRMLGLAALALLGLSAIAIVAYVIWFLRGPRTTSA